MKPATPPKDALTYMTEIHIRKYKMYLDVAAKGAKYVRVDETKKLLAIWESIQTKGYIYDNLTQEEKDEADDAYANF